MTKAKLSELQKCGLCRDSIQHHRNLLTFSALRTPILIRKFTVPLLASLLLMISWLFSCQPTSKAIDDQQNLKELTQLLIGDYNNQKQHSINASIPQTELHICTVWEERNAETWLYMEQVIVGDAKQPKREVIQSQIHKLEIVNQGLYQSIIYDLPELGNSSENYAGSCQQQGYFDNITPDSLTQASTGCILFVRKIADGYYRGGTREGTCFGSDTTVAITTELEIFEDKIIYWDRYFDMDGKQMVGNNLGSILLDRSF